MKNSFLLLCFFLVSLSGLKAQAFPIGTTWYYLGYLYQSPSAPRVPKTISITDTLTVDGKLAHRFTGSCNCYETPQYIALENGIFYQYFDADSATMHGYDTTGWLKLYNFNLNAGERDTAYFGKRWSEDCVLWHPYLVDSVSWVETTSGDSLKVLHLNFWTEIQSVNNSCHNFGHTLIENIGSDECMFPRFGFVEGCWYPFLCYEINGITQYSPSGLDCDMVSGLPESIEKEEVRYVVSPNPTIGIIQWRPASDLALNQQVVLAEVYDALGRRVVSIRKPDYGIDLSELPAGLYRLLLWDPDGKVLLTQLVEKI